MLNGQHECVAICDHSIAWESRFPSTRVYSCACLPEVVHSFAFIALRLDGNCEVGLYSIPNTDYEGKGLRQNETHTVLWRFEHLGV